VGELRGLRTDKTKLLLTMYARPEKELRRAATEALQVQICAFEIFSLFLPSDVVRVLRARDLISCFCFRNSPSPVWKRPSRPFCCSTTHTCVRFCFRLSYAVCVWRRSIPCLNCRSSGRITFAVNSLGKQPDKMVICKVSSLTVLSRVTVMRMC